jgi:hypothetical protein
MAPTIYTFPAITPHKTRLTLSHNAGLFVSPFTAFTQGFAREGTRWVMEMQFRNLNPTNKNALKAFLAHLNGVQHRFNVHDHSHEQLGSMTGTPRVKGANQSGNSLVTDGWVYDITLRAGNHLSYVNANGRSELKMITEDTLVNGLGNATIPVSPEIHTSPADNATIEVTNPEGTFILADPDMSWDNDPGAGAFLTVRGIEDLA